ncbi:outer membrane lipoprotein carrier protein LolA [Thioalkalivibrio sulfidiphilus HL-EbGr7]|uniref:Outer-membrane lipoprotein carrier protein n=1 Tax=Thioalkalivibrio sulfidiphilus (strain HL-EbGR7) TaxID=396588 RepID=B8GT68_THISH|nr:outer membrane lipoprotein chaperone LolA [Thioalkalivibrio sulfidiphilus]ACL73083.1 outer membrane lipoprotein carrier protein LolA [Thioalkalivibrio sulfidiphilus HL-EbGr7]
MFRYLLASLLALTLATPAFAADARQSLERFFSEVSRFDARFEQLVINEQDEVLQASEGRVQLQRPGRFRWDYEQPFRQLIIADGQFLWTYDEELAQATAQPMERVLAGAPIMLLSEPRPLEQDFEVSVVGERGELNWVELTPRDRDADFTRILIGMDGDRVGMMVLYDQFGQQTRIRFSNMRINPSIPAATFRFEAPPGVDVIRH